MADVAISIIVRFWIYLISNIISILCSIFVLYYLLFDRQLRRSLHNHVVIAIIIVNFICAIIDIPWILYYYKSGVVLIYNSFICTTVKFIDSVTYVITARLVAWASIERHILVFHSHWVSNKRRIILVHYLPLLFIAAYTTILYLVITYFLSCDRPLRPTSQFCGFYSCAYDSKAYSMFEFFSGGVLNSIVIAFFSASLIVRVVRQKHRMNQQIDWRKQRKMTVQLISITALFYVLYLPSVLISILTNAGVPRIYFDDFLVYAQFFSYYINFLLPLVCAGTLPHLMLKVKNTLCFWTWNRSHAAAVGPLHTVAGRRTLEHSSVSMKTKK